MAKFMFLCSYSPDGLKGLLKDKASGRKEAIERVAQSVGGRLDAVYYGLGEYDAYVICDLPDVATATTVAVTVSATGLVATKTVPLLTVEETDRALSRSVAYRAPGQ
ncbi:MAG: GYD domain-containing protein [Stellaceae bacterium]